jgi:hypothetical protein
MFKYPCNSSMEEKPFKKKGITMNLCFDGHDEVCYEGRKCPCCELLKDNQKLEDELYDLKDAIANLKTEE